MIYEIFSTILALVFVIAVPISIISGIVCLFSNKTNALKILQYSGITSIVSLILIAGCIAYEQGIEEDNTIEQLQIENAELNKQIQAIKQEHKECEAHIKDLQTRYDLVCQENAEIREELYAEESNEEEIAIASEEPEEAVNNDTNTNNDLSNAYGTKGYNSNYDSYYHDYSDCKFIRDKKVYQLTGDEVLNRTECKCVYSGRFWE